MDMQAHTLNPKDSKASTYYTIEQVATTTDLTKRTLRYYEELGLLKPTERTEGNYRRYTDEDIQRIEYIKKLRDLLGFSLNEIRSLLDTDDERAYVREAYQHETDIQRKIEQLDIADNLILEQVVLIEHKIAGLEQMRHSLLERLERHKQKRHELNE